MDIDTHLRKIHVLLLCLMCLLVSGCPHQLVRQAEDLVPPPGYRPQYLTQRTTLNDVLSEIDSLRRLSGGAGDIMSLSTDGRNRALGEVSEADRASSAPRETTSGEAAVPLLATGINIIESDGYPDSVRIRMHVFDHRGQYISGLAPPFFAGEGSYRDYWQVLYDSCKGTNNRIDSFTVREVRDDGSDPHAVAFVLDHSPSMGNRRARRLQEATRRALTIIKPEDYVSVLKFTSKMYPEVPLSNDPEVYRSRFKVDSLKGYTGGTAIYTAVLNAAQELLTAPPGHKRAIILFTDGEDNSSKVSLDSVMRFCRENNVKVFPVAYGVTEERALRELAEYSRGKFYRMYSVREFGLVFTDIYRSLRNYYLLTYRPPECAALHTVQVPLYFPEIDFRIEPAIGTYDKSLLNAMTPVGTITFVPIEFETGKSDIRPASLPLIDQIAESMKETPSLKIEIRGHTDDVGSSESNQKLSEERAESVRKYLLRRGIPATRLRAVGFGQDKPIVPNTSDENRARNRRTEFVILER